VRANTAFPLKLIDTNRTAERLRQRVIDPAKRQILISKLEGSAQAQDFTLPANCEGFGRVRHFRRTTAPGWPLNPLPIDPAAKALALPRTDLLRAQAFQNAACPWRCWYCYVPFDMLAGNSNLGRWFGADDLIELYLAEADRPAVIDLTGGSPDLTPEWVPWMMSALRDRGLERSVYLWSDDNLSTDYLWRYVSEAELVGMAQYLNYARVACFKGFDSDSFAFNTRATPDAFDFQFELMGRLLALGIDCYGYATFTGPCSADVPSRMAQFVDRLQTLDENLPLRTIPLHIDAYTPVISRMNEARREALKVQDVAIAAWNLELERRFSAHDRALLITDVACGSRNRR
jgi:uncharacterized Fe-S cluster-containing radical SAM superfamily protein